MLLSHLWLQPSLHPKYIYIQYSPNLNKWFMADVKCIRVSGSCKEASKLHHTNNIRQNKCVWLTVTIHRNSLKQFNDPACKRSRRNTWLSPGEQKELQNWNCYKMLLKMSYRVRMKEDLFYCKKPILPRLLKNQLFLGVCQINASEPAWS